MEIPLVDLKAQYSAIRGEVNAGIQAVLDDSSFVLGRRGEEFEDGFGKFCGARHAIGVSSGTAALHLALLAGGIGKGDEVITTGNTFIATTEVISHAGARPVLVDIDRETYNLDTGLIEEKINKRTRAIMPVHIYGQTCDMDEIMEIAEKHELKVIEDACQAHGAEYKGKKAGSFGDVGCFSFYPSKNLGAYGDGGMVVTDDDDVFEQVKLLRDHGRKGKYEHVIDGYNYRLDEIQAAVLGVKLKHLDKWNEERRKNARIYDKTLKDVIIPVERKNNRHVYHMYVILAEGRDGLRGHLMEAGISTGVHYPIPVHMQPACGYLGYKRGDFPVAEECSERFLSLPMYPELDEKSIRRVSEAVGEFYGK